MEANQKQAQECLSNIDREAAAIKTTVDQSHEKLHQTIQNLKKMNNPELAHRAQLFPDKRPLFFSTENNISLYITPY